MPVPVPMSDGLVVQSGDLLWVRREHGIQHQHSESAAWDMDACGVLARRIS